MKKVISIFVLMLFSLTAMSQQQRPGIDPVNLETHLLKIPRIGSDLTRFATGYFYQSPTNKIYLIANYHFICNEDPYTRERLDNNSYDTTSVWVTFLTKAWQEPILRSFKFRRKDGTDRVSKFKMNQNSYYDVVAIHLPDSLLSDVIVRPVSILRDFDNVSIHPTDKFFVLGYPGAHHSEKYFPIWKSGTLSTETTLDPEGYNYLYLDMKGKDGMSGSPVYWFPDEIRYYNANPINNTGKNRKGYLVGMYLGETFEVPKNAKMPMNREEQLKMEQVGMSWAMKASTLEKLLSTLD